MSNNALGISNPRTRESQIKLWNRCILKWNKTHSATKVPLSTLADELHLKWPQMYVSLSEDELYCSFSYADYIFYNNGNGQICGGMFIREGEKPTNAINMTASQIVDLIGIIRPMPFLGRKISLEAEIHVLMGRIYYFTYQWDLADYCFKESYNQYYRIFERPDWKDFMYADVPKEEREEYDDNIIGSYTNWANSLASEKFIGIEICPEKRSDHWQGANY